MPEACAAASALQTSLAHPPLVPALYDALVDEQRDAAHGGVGRGPIGFGPDELRHRHPRLGDPERAAPLRVVGDQGPPVLEQRIRLATFGEPRVDRGDRKLTRQAVDDGAHRSTAGRSGYANHLDPDART